MAKDNVKNLLTDEKGKQDGRKKAVNVMLSILIAIALWGYVIVSVDPETSRTITNVDISVTGKGDLRERGLAVVDEGELMTSALITGNRSDIYNVRENQVRASIDVSGCVLGENQVAISFDRISGVDDAEAKPEYVTVMVDRMITEKKSVEIVAEGTPEGYEVGRILLEVEKMDVTGGTSLLEKVDHLEAVLVVEPNSETYALTLEVVPVDASGERISGLLLEDNEVYVEAQLLKTKTVDLLTTFMGSEDDEVVITKTAPKEITIRGKEEDLKEINSVIAEPVDVTGITEDTKYKLVLQLPEGIELADSQKAPSATLTVETASSKVLNYRSSEISVNGLPEGKKASLEDREFTVTIKGSASQLQSVTKDNTKIFIDVTGFAGSEGVFPVQASSSAGAKDIKISPESVTVKIKLEE